MFKIIITCAAVVGLIITVSGQTNSAPPPSSARPSSAPPTSAPATTHLPDLPVETSVSNVIMENIKTLLEEWRPLVQVFSKRACTAAQGWLSTMLNETQKKKFNEIREKNRDKFAEIKMPGPITFKNISMANSEINFSKLQLFDIVLKGLDGVIVNKYDFDVCQLYYEMETTVPTLQVTAKYTLDGMVYHSPVSGAGQLSLDIYEMNETAFTNLACELELIPDKTCKGSQKKTTFDLSIAVATVNMTGLKYNGNDERKINEDINTYISHYIASTRIIDMTEIYTKMSVSLKPLWKFELTSLLEAVIKFPGGGELTM